MTRTYINQFTINEERPLYVPAFLLSDSTWVDNSWGNDVSPRWVNESLRLCLWVDYDKAEDREIEECTKYTICQVIDDEGTLADGSLLETDDEGAIVNFMLTWPIKQTLERAIFETSAVIEGLSQLPEGHPLTSWIARVEDALDELVTVQQESK